MLFSPSIPRRKEEGSALLSSVLYGLGYRLGDVYARGNSASASEQFQTTRSKGYAGFEQVRKLLVGHGPAEIVPLPLLASLGLKKYHFFKGFHALRNHSQIETSSHVDDRSHDRRLTGGTINFTGEGLIDL